MPKPTDIQIKDATCATTDIDYRVPIKFGGRVVVDVTVLDVTVEVESRSGRRAVGTGSMPLGNAWAWPSRVVSTDKTLSAMVQLGQRLVAFASDCSECGHPIEITHAMAPHYAMLAQRTIDDLGLEEPMPRLAQLVSASPLEAAIHDAFGKLLGRNSYNVLGPEFVNAT